MASPTPSTDPNLDRALASDGAWPWRVVLLALGGLLVAVIGAAIVALALTGSVTQVAERALTRDVAFEDEAEDVHVAVLDLEHEHRALVLVGITRAAREDHQTSIEALRDELQELAALGMRPAGVVDPAELAASIDRYQDDLTAVIDAAGVGQAAIDEAFDAGLARLAVLERDAAALDAVGTARAADALRELSATTALASAVLVGILVAAVIAGVALMVVAARVLRELRRASAAERMAAAGLADLLRARSDFIADASHELRTPLTVLRGNAELGLRLAPIDDDHVPILREIAGETTRMGRLVEELLLLARHDAGDAMSQPRRAELEALAADAVARSEVLCRGRGVRLESDATAFGEAVIDADRIEQAILILVDNASTHSRPGDAVSLRIAADAGELLIEVGDRGPGIPADVRPHIFERFHRAERSRRGQEGAGLGLAIARAIAEEHRGTITPGDRPDGGTLMTIRIPLVRPEDAAPGDDSRRPGRSR